MKHLIAVLALTVCSATVAEGQIERIPLFDANGGRRGRIDTLFVRGFSRGDTTRPNQQQFQTFRQFVRNLAPGQQVFLRGTADAYRFPGVSDARNRQLNQNLAEGRAQRATEVASQEGVTARTLTALIDQPLEDRGVWAYKVTYASTEADAAADAAGAANLARAGVSVQSAVQTPPVDTVFRVDSIVRIDSIFIENTTLVSDGRRWRFGVGGGAQSLLTVGGGGMEFIVPTISAFAQHNDRWFVTLAGGWRPMPEVTLGGQFPPNMNRAESIVAVSAALFPKRDSLPGILGVAFGIRGAWETVRREDEFLERAYGIAVGPRLRLPTHFLVLGLDFQLANESRFRGGETRWRFGFAPSLSVNHTFGRRVSR